MSDKKEDFKAFLTGVLRKPGANVKEMFLSYDSDGNQSLDLDEFRKFYGDLEKIIDSQGWQDEGGDDGTDMVGVAFKEIDSDQNGVISFDEFKLFIEQMSMAYSMAESMKGW
eukprot:TRINITY_DN13622_c0_g1_i1.p1 TRINITY_DN13622_c0_g1~~TRINITY_DN13622_c0_g1_i1.p1  ORF type:complete len:112 (-),score=22.34 TRINITY_DN13622_c0_g1_i1:97-432(-)